MANRKAITISILVLIILSCAGYYLMQALHEENVIEAPNATGATEAKLGTIDVNKVLRQHPEYQKLLQLKKEYNDLAAEAEGMKNFKANGPMPAAVDTAALGNSAQQLRNQKIKAKQAELNERLGKKDAQYRAEHAAELEAQIKAIDETYLPQIFNLQLKLDTLQIDQDAAAQIISRMNELKAEHSLEVREHQRKFFARIAELMKAEQDSATQELNAYVKAVDQEIGKAVQAKRSEIETRNHLAMREKANEIKLESDGQTAAVRKMMGKEREIAALEDKIRADISDKTAKVAAKQNLSAVLSAVKVNLSAMDITDFVIEEFKK